MSTVSEPRDGGLSPASAEFTARELAAIALKSPEAYRDLIRQKELHQRHLRHVAWSDFIAQMVGRVCGLLALSVLAIVAWHALDLGDADQGAAIICTGAVSIVAVFVTGRLTISSPSKTEDEKRSKELPFDP
jgi:hypothetical protein